MMLGVEKPRGAVRNTLPEGRGRKGVWADYMWGTKIYIFKQFLADFRKQQYFAGFLMLNFCLNFVFIDSLFHVFQVMRYVFC